MENKIKPQERYEMLGQTLNLDIIHKREKYKKNQYKVKQFS